MKREMTFTYSTAMMNMLWVSRKRLYYENATHQLRNVTKTQKNKLYESARKRYTERTCVAWCRLSVSLSVRPSVRSAWRTLCHEAVTQFEDSRVEALEHKKQFGRGLNLAATSALGHVTVALASAAPELD